MCAVKTRCCYKHKYFLDDAPKLGLNSVFIKSAAAAVLQLASVVIPGRAFNSRLSENALLVMLDCVDMLTVGMVSTDDIGDCALGPDSITSCERANEHNYEWSICGCHRYHSTHTHDS